jgi:hypothetical protein
MTKQQFQAKFQDLIDSDDFTTFINKRAKELLNSGAVDLDTFDDDYQLPKIVLCAVLKDLTWQYMPLTQESKKLVKNLERF